MQPARECTDLRLPRIFSDPGHSTRIAISSGSICGPPSNGKQIKFPGKACTRQLEYFPGNPALINAPATWVISSVTDECVPWLLSIARPEHENRETFNRRKLAVPLSNYFVLLGTPAARVFTRVVGVLSAEGLFVDGWYARERRRGGRWTGCRPFQIRALPLRDAFSQDKRFRCIKNKTSEVKNFVIIVKNWLHSL